MLKANGYGSLPFKLELLNRDFVFINTDLSSLYYCQARSSYELIKQTFYYNFKVASSDNIPGTRVIFIISNYCLCYRCIFWLIKNMFYMNKKKKNKLLVRLYLLHFIYTLSSSTFFPIIISQRTVIEYWNLPRLYSIVEFVATGQVIDGEQDGHIITT